MLPQALGQTFDVGDIPADLKEQADEYYELLVEAAVSLDDGAMEAYLEGVVRPAICTVLPESVHMRLTSWAVACCSASLSRGNNSSASADRFRSTLAM